MIEKDDDFAESFFFGTVVAVVDEVAVNLANAEAATPPAPPAVTVMGVEAVGDP